jgi:GNAT superfamily N-acetyltransferase
MGDLITRPAVIEDVPLILTFIRELAEYEHLSDQVTATEELLTEWIFRQKKAEVLIGELDGKPIGYALYFYNFSTFLGRAGIYIEDIFIRPAYRKNGFGKKFFKHLTGICAARGCGRLEWACLDWNKPSIDFYLSLGARQLDEWTIYRLSGEELRKLAEG